MIRPCTSELWHNSCLGNIAQKGETRHALLRLAHAVHCTHYAHQHLLLLLLLLLLSPRRATARR
jgi:hypothetical protein